MIGSDTGGEKKTEKCKITLPILTYIINTAFVASGFCLFSYIHNHLQTVNLIETHNLILYNKLKNYDGIFLYNLWSHLSVSTPSTGMYPADV